MVLLTDRRLHQESLRSGRPGGTDPLRQVRWVAVMEEAALKRNGYVL